LSTLDFSHRDEPGQVAFFVLLWKRKGLDLTLFDDYWRDVHGPVCARLPGQFQYWQYHVHPNNGGIIPQIDGIEYTTVDADQFAGIAELTFKTPEDRVTWFQAAAILMDDEHNIFSKAIGYNTSPSNSITYLDKLADGAPNGDTLASLVRLFILIKKNPAVSPTEFQAYFKDKFAPAIATSSHLAKFRLNLFDEVDGTRPPAAGVEHSESADKSYHASLELAFENNLELESFLASPDYKATEATQSQYIQAIATFPTHFVNTFVYEGKMTLAGQRGSSVAQLITKIGAINQLQPDIVDLMLNNSLT
jgi:hypothetical protein